MVSNPSFRQNRQVPHIIPLYGGFCRYSRGRVRRLWGQRSAAFASSPGVFFSLNAVPEECTIIVKGGKYEEKHRQMGPAVPFYSSIGLPTMDT